MVGFFSPKLGDNYDESRWAPLRLVAPPGDSRLKTSTGHWHFSTLVEPTHGDAWEEI